MLKWYQMDAADKVARNTAALTFAAVMNSALNSPDFEDEDGEFTREVARKSALGGYVLAEELDRVRSIIRDAARDQEPDKPDA